MKNQDEVQLIHDIIGERFHYKKVKDKISNLCMDKNSFLEPIDFTTHTDVETLPQKGTTSVSRIAKG